jgi:hypothetical protein
MATTIQSSQYGASSKISTALARSFERPGRTTQTVDATRPKASSATHLAAPVLKPRTPPPFVPAPCSMQTSPSNSAGKPQFPATPPAFVPALCNTQASQSNCRSRLPELSPVLLSPTSTAFTQARPRHYLPSGFRYHVQGILSSDTSSSQQCHSSRPSARSTSWVNNPGLADLQSSGRADSIPTPLSALLTVATSCGIPLFTLHSVFPFLSFLSYLFFLYIKPTQPTHPDTDSFF